MAHGKSDWNRTAGLVTTYQLDDLGEHAGRVGSINTFDRRGDLIWFDDFENSINKWLVSAPDTGAAAAISTTRARNGSNSALLTAGSDGTLTTDILHRSPFTSLSRIGLEMSWSIDSVFDTLLMQVFARDGTNQLQPQIRYDKTNQVLEFFNNGSTFTSLATGLDLTALPTFFHTWKMVFDMASGEYVRVILDNTEFDLSGNPVLSAASALEPHLQLAVFLAGRAAQNDTMFIDDVILTQNEP